MLKDSKGDWVKILEITDELCKSIVQETFSGPEQIAMLIRFCSKLGS